MRKYRDLTLKVIKMFDDIKSIIKVVAWGIFACSAILLVFGSSGVSLGSIFDNTLLIDNGWGLVELGAVLFIITIIAWVIVKLFGDSSL